MWPQSSLWRKKCAFNFLLDSILIMQLSHFQLHPNFLSFFIALKKIVKLAKVLFHGNKTLVSVDLLFYITTHCHPQKVKGMMIMKAIASSPFKKTHTLIWYQIQKVVKKPYLSIYLSKIDFNEAWKRFFRHHQRSINHQKTLDKTLICQAGDDDNKNWKNGSKKMGEKIVRLTLTERSMKCKKKGWRPSRDFAKEIQFHHRSSVTVSENNQKSHI